MNNLPQQAREPACTQTSRDYRCVIESWRVVTDFTTFTTPIVTDRPRYDCDTPIPIILHTGYLGSGKTALLNRLRQNSDQR